MNDVGNRNFCIIALCAAFMAGAGQNIALGQAPAGSQPASAAPARAPLKAEQIDQLLSPIALYPDALLAQVLMASTYPLEIVQAARWGKSNKGKTGAALEAALQAQSWDPSVKSLVAVPQVLQMMDERLDWAQRLGDTFLAQREDVMNSVQRLRAKAVAAGKLQSTKEQKISTQTIANKTVIVVQPANPQTVYVPVYNPAVVYGAWSYPAYPPYPYYPPGYVAGTALAFTTGMVVGAALWGGVNWGRNDIDINVNQFNSYNRTNITNNNWQHNSAHRHGVPYRDAGVAQQFGRGQGNAGASRDEFRGRSTADLTSQLGERSREGQRSDTGARDRSSADRRRQDGGRAGGAGAQSSRPDAAGRGGVTNNAFANLDRGSAALANADRGRASLGGTQGLGGGGARDLGGGRFGGGGGGRFGGGGGGRRR
jgi:hypothetical protein